MKLKQKDVTVRRTFPGGYLVCSAVVGGDYLQYKYIGYPKREAVRLFVQWVNGGAK